MGKEHKCPDCGYPCNAMVCDSGIGSGAFWGKPFNDVNEYMGSDCCDARLDGVEFPEPDEPPDWREDERYGL